VVIFDFNVDNVNRTIKFTTTRKKVIAYRVETSFFTGNYYIGYSLTIMPTLRCSLDVSITVQHLQ